MTDENSIDMVDFKVAEDSLVDYVLVYNTPSCIDATSSKTDLDANAESMNKRKQFEDGLRQQGLRLEIDVDGCLTYVKITADRKVLRKFCEILKFQMPIKQQQNDAEATVEGETVPNTTEQSQIMLVRKFFRLDPRDPTKDDKPVLLAAYSRGKFYLFDEDSADFFTPTIRILVVDFILNRQCWTENLSTDDNGGGDTVLGIRHLLNERVYEAAYPIHDGDYKDERSCRRWLLKNWACLNRWSTYQPIDRVRQYLGTECAFYFAWLGFYNHMLIFASIIGLLVVLYGFATLSNDNFSEEICNNSVTGDVIMCPLCNQICDYWELSESCLSAKISHLVDNPSTVVFAFFMSVWGTVFLELWKRYSSVLKHSWGLTGYTVQAEHPRPQFLIKLSNCPNKKLNVVTGHVEPTVGFWSVKIPVMLFSYTIIIFFVLLAIGAVFSVVIYRMWLMTVFHYIDKLHWFSKNASIVITISAASINLICIMVLNSLYGKVAILLTDMELPRTQTDYERSLTIKTYLFQFVNYYASLIYMAFFKGKFLGYPGNYNTIFGFRQEECSSSGCMMDLSFQLAFIMIGKQLLNALIEMVMPILKNLLKSYSVERKQSPNKKMGDWWKNIKCNQRQWTHDYKLADLSDCGLFAEYLEMVIQFGFVTLFVSAFPLAPLFALVNNVFELRFDAHKLLKYYRRPIPRLAPNIGVWYRILDVIGKLSVITNAVIISFSSTFIPHLVYPYDEVDTNISNTIRLSPYLQHSLSYFNVTDFQFAAFPSAYNNISYCRYAGYRTPPWSEKKYYRTSLYWKVMLARIVFILIFQNVVHAVKVCIQWIIPDVPAKLSDLMKKEAYLTTQLIIQKEKQNNRPTIGSFYQQP